MKNMILANYSTAKLFDVLSSDVRSEILKSLTEDGPITVSQFLRQHHNDKHGSKITIQGLSKHFKKLDKARLVKRNKDGSFSVTPLGYAVRWQLPPFGLLARYSEYFNSHATNKIPKKFVQEMQYG
ncbi:MAG: winged helix-turn-helix domain-containing protein [Nitrosotalea sp.]